MKLKISGGGGVLRGKERRENAMKSKIVTLINKTDKNEDINPNFREKKNKT